MRAGAMLGVVGLVSLAGTSCLAGTVVGSSPGLSSPVLVETKWLPALPYDAGTVRFIVPSEASGGTQAVVELTEMPGYKTAWHAHDNCDEAFYVLEGELTIKIGEQQRILPAGSFVLIPRGTPHGQGNFSDRPLRLLTTFTPGGFDEFFRDRVELFKRTQPGSEQFTARFNELRAKHRKWVTILGAWDPAAAAAPAHRETMTRR